MPLCSIAALKYIAAMNKIIRLLFFVSALVIGFFAPAQDNNYTILREFPGGNKLALKSGKWGLLGPNNEIIYPFELYDSYKKLDNGLLRIKQEVPDSIYSSQEGKFIPHETMYYGLLDERNGAIVFPPKFKYMGEFSGGPVKVSTDSLSGMIDNAGKIILPIVYRTLELLPGGNYMAANPTEVLFLDPKLKVLSRFDDLVRFERLKSREAYAFLFTTKDRVGIINCNGKRISEPDWKEVEGSERKYAFIRTRDNQYVVFDINKDKLIIKGYYESKQLFEHGEYIIMIKGSVHSVFDPSGKRMGQFTCDSFFDNDGFGFFIKRKELWGYADRHGKILIEPKWKYSSPLQRYPRSDGSFRLSMNGTDWQYYNSEAKPTPAKSSY